MRGSKLHRDRHRVSVRAPWRYRVSRSMGSRQRMDQAHQLFAAHARWLRRHRDDLFFDDGSVDVVRAEA